MGDGLAKACVSVWRLRLEERDVCLGWDLYDYDVDEFCFFSPFWLRDTESVFGGGKRVVMASTSGGEEDSKQIYEDKHQSYHL